MCVRCSDLIYLIDQLVGLIRKHSDLIRDYYLEFLAGADLRGVQKVLGGPAARAALP